MERRDVQKVLLNGSLGLRCLANRQRSTVKGLDLRGPIVPSVFTLTCFTRFEGRTSLKLPFTVLPHRSPTTVLPPFSHDGVDGRDGLVRH